MLEEEATTASISTMVHPMTRGGKMKSTEEKMNACSAPANFSAEPSPTDDSFKNL